MSEESHDRKPVVPVGGGVPFDPETGERYGYLPPKAAGRKLVIRAQLGLPWVLGALGAAAVLAVAGGVFLAQRPDRPGRPYADQGPLHAYAEQDVTPLADSSGWLDRRSGVRAYAGPELAFCPVEGGWVTAAGDRYDDTGAGLTVVPVRVAGGRVYVDPTRPSRLPGTPEPLPPCTLVWRIGEARPADGA